MSVTTGVSSGKIKRHLKTLSIGFFVFSTIAVFSADTYAQSINDDLKPKQSITKTKPSAKKSVKTNKNPSNRNTPKPKVARTASVSRTQPSNYAASETSDQIINRFMNFQQSAGVTDRDWKSVIVQTTKTLKDNPNHSTAKAQSLIAQGQLAYNSRNFSMAITSFKEALQIMPASSLLHYSLGKTYLANGQAKLAERSLKESINQNENFALAYKSLGDAYAAQGEKKTATKYFRRATEISVKDGNMAP